MFTIKRLSFLLTIIIAVNISCGNLSQRQQEIAESETGTEKNTTQEEDAKANFNCTISIDDKKFTIPGDSISTAYQHLDSSLTITFKGFGQGHMLFRVPNFFKAPCTIPTGFSSIETKRLFVNDKDGLAPTVELYMYPFELAKFRNLNDGKNPKAVMPNAAEITEVQKIGESKSLNQMYYSVTGKIHTTVLKNVFNEDAGEKNKDYKINADFTLKAGIYYLDN